MFLSQGPLRAAPPNCSRRFFESGCGFESWRAVIAALTGRRPSLRIRCSNRCKSSCVKADSGIVWPSKRDLAAARLGGLSALRQCDARFLQC